MATRPDGTPSRSVNPFLGAGGAVPIAAGALCLLGWQFSIRPLTSVVPGLVAMNPVTALGFVLCGASLLMLGSERSGPGARAAARALALLATLVGALKLAAIVFGQGPEIDQWLFRDALGGASGLPHNRMAPNTALNFVLAGTCLLALDRKTRGGGRPAQGLVLVPMLLSLMAVVGYAYGVKSFYGVPAFIPMALNTAVAFLALCLGIFFARPSQGLAAQVLGRDAGGLTVRTLLPVSVLVLAGSGWLMLRGQMAGLYDDRFGVCLLVICSIVLMATTIWVNSLSIRRQEAARRRASEALDRAHADLEARVEQRTAELARVNRELEREVAERRRAEATSGKLSRAIEQTADLVVITDRDGIVEYVNTAVVALTGYTPGEMIGRTPAILKSGQHDAEFYQRMWSTIRSGHSFRATFVNRKKDGTHYHEEKTLTPIRDEQGAITNYVSTGKDITGHLKLEEQLRQSQKMEAIGRLAGGVAHDFNNLLTAILGFNGLAQSRLAGQAPVLADLGEVEKAAMRAASLTRQLLALSRQQRMQRQPLALNVVVTELDKMLRRLIGADVDLLTGPAAGLGCVLADPGQMEQVILNLVVNARDAMPGGGKLTIETANVEIDEAYAQGRPPLRPGPYVVLAVTDTGCGMTAKVKSHIFEPFFTTKEAGRGTGLGLSTVHGIIQQSDGHIEVYSEPGRGTTFKIYLPRAEASPAPLGRPTVAKGSLRGTERVLLVEDEEQVRQVVRVALEGHGYQVIEAENAWDAARLCDRADQPFHLLLTDVVMPGMNGPDLGARVAQAQPGAKILYMSGCTDKAIVHQGVLGPDTPFLQKPFGPEQLLRKVREVLDDAQERAA